MLKDNALFVQEFFRSFNTTGTICPTTRWAAQAMVAPLANRSPKDSAKILELGPGTGSVTKYILRNMNFGDRLSICEINERFMDHLKDILEEDDYYQAHKARIDFHCCPMQELPEDTKYDLIVCAIPLLNFSVDDVKEMFNKIGALSHEKTIMTQYEYIGLRDLGKQFRVGQDRLRMKQLDGFIERVQSSHLSKKTHVWRNILPINVFEFSKLHNLHSTIGH